MNKPFLFWRYVIHLVSSCLLFTDFALATEPTSAEPSPQQTNYQLTLTPLSEQILIQPTAKHLKAGEVIFNLDNRLFSLPDLVESSVDDDDTAANTNTGFVWGISDRVQLTLQFQRLDSSSPARQGDFTSERTENNEAAGELKYQLWQNDNQTQALSGVIAASWGTRGFRFIGDNRDLEINNRNVFVALAFPYTADLGEKWQLTISPTVAFFNENNAAFFHRLPGDDATFGTVAGLAGGASYEVNPRLFLWGDVFFPFSGNNSISRASGSPDTAIAYNGGLRYLVNPRLALDFYASNTFGSLAPLSLTADRDLVAFGTNIRVMPDLFAANRQYSDRFDPHKQDLISPLTTDGLAFYDGGTVGAQDFILNSYIGTQGILNSLRYGLLKDLEASVFLDHVFGETDESEQGYGLKIRLLNQAEGSPLTVSLAGTASITNQPFLNFLNNNPNEFANSDFDQEIPIFSPGADDIEEGKQIIVTFAVPLQYQIAQDTAIWLTPTVGFIQRNGTELAGFNFGGSVGLNDELSALVEVGANFAGEGNSLNAKGLEDRIPWTVALRWTPLSLFGLEPSLANSNPLLELYVTNRVGFSTWHNLRVRENNDLAIGLGFQFPF